MAVDFLQPAGAPALIAADSISWRIFANPVSLFIGGVAAVLLELAEPSVRSGVWDHSSFERDPLTRLKRTGFAAMVTVYAPREQAEKLIARVVQMHGHVKGLTPDGLAYTANDPRLLNWVQATASFGFCEAYHQYVQALTTAEKSQVLAEGKLPASLYGATDSPASWPQWQQLLEHTAPGLESSAILADFLDIMERAPLLPAPLRPLQKITDRCRGGNDTRARALIRTTARARPQSPATQLRQNTGAACPMAASAGPARRPGQTKNAQPALRPLSFALAPV